MKEHTIQASSLPVDGDSLYLLGVWPPNSLGITTVDELNTLGFESDLIDPTFVTTGVTCNLINIGIPDYIHEFSGITIDGNVYGSGKFLGTSTTNINFYENSTAGPATWVSASLNGNSYANNINSSGGTTTINEDSLIDDSILDFVVVNGTPRTFTNISSILNLSTTVEIRFVNSLTLMGSGGVSSGELLILNNCYITGATISNDVKVQSSSFDTVSFSGVVIIEDDNIAQVIFSAVEFSNDVKIEVEATFTNCIFNNDFYLISEYARFVAADTNSGTISVISAASPNYIGRINL